MAVEVVAGQKVSGLCGPRSGPTLFPKNIYSGGLGPYQKLSTPMIFVAILQRSCLVPSPLSVNSGVFIKKAQKLVGFTMHFFASSANPLLPPSGVLGVSRRPWDTFSPTSGD